MSQIGKLVAIEDGLFFVGMRLHRGVFCRRNGIDVLMCKDVVLDEPLIAKLRRASKTGGIFIEEDSYEEIWKESLRVQTKDTVGFQEKCKQVSQEYDKVLAETVGLLGEAVASPRGTPLGIAHSISSDISNTLRGYDQSLLLNCINQIHTADDYLYTHCVNVATLNGMIGQWMKLPKHEIDLLIKIGLLHDLGKLRIPPFILNKPGKLTEGEFEEMKRHPIYSYEILLASGETDEKILQGVRSHHEKVNGLGYPDGFSKDSVPLSARITSVSDVYDAMVSKRCYKEERTPFEILAQFEQNRFSDLDAGIVDIFLKNAPYLFTGMRVLLSTNEEAEVIFIKEKDYANPIVRVGKRIFPTDSHCRCVKICEQPFR